MGESYLKFYKGSALLFAVDHAIILTNRRACLTPGCPWRHALSEVLARQKKFFPSPEICSLEWSVSRESVIKHHIFRSRSSRLKNLPANLQSWERTLKKTKKSRKFRWKFMSALYRTVDGAGSFASPVSSLSLSCSGYRTTQALSTRRCWRNSSKAKEKQVCTLREVSYLLQHDFKSGCSVRNVNSSRVNSAVQL